MAKLHELLAAEKTPTAAWNALFEDTLKKFKNPAHFFEGHTKSLAMLDDSPANKAIEDAAREDKAVPTNVFDTLDFALGIYGTMEDLLFQKNITNTRAFGIVMWKGAPLFKDAVSGDPYALPVDQLLGLEERLKRIRALFAEMPTLDATKHWRADEAQGAGMWVTEYPDETTKTEKVMVPVVMAPATDKHPAQVQAVTKDIVVGKYTAVRRSGACTAYQKSETLKLIDELMVEVKQARMRANETAADTTKIAGTLVGLLLSHLKPATKG